MYLRTLHLRARGFSLLAVAAIVFAIVVFGALAVRYKQAVAAEPAGTPVRNVDSAVWLILQRAAPYVLPALALALAAELLAWRNEAAIHDERRHLEQLMMQRHYLDALYTLQEQALGQRQVETPVRSSLPPA